MATSSTTQNQKNGSSTSTSGSSTSNTNTYTQGHSSSTTVGYSDTTSSSQGGANSLSSGKSYASGEISNTTQNKFNQYNQDYVQSENVTNAYNNLQAALQNKPTFESTYADRLNSIYDQIMNRQKFNYNFNEDAMYQLYKDQYSQMGQQAMQDTMGQAAALTGGYGSSYAQTVGQQQYQNYLTQLNNMIPELRNQAYQEYQAEGEDLLNKYNLTNTAYNNEYGMYRDSMNDWQTDRSFNQSAYADERNYDLSKYQSDRNYWQSEYWNEKNAEQSNIQRTDTSNWEDSKSHTDSRSQTESDYWENSSSTTNTTSNSISNTTGWKDTTSKTNSTGSGSGSSSGSTKWSNNGSVSSGIRNGTVDTAAELYRSYAQANNQYDSSGNRIASESEVKSAQKEFTDYMKDLRKYGSVNENGQVVSVSDQDICAIYRSVLSEMNDGGAYTYTDNEILKLLGLKK